MWQLVTFPIIVKYIYHHFLLNEHLCLLSILGQATLYLKLQLILNQSCAVDSRTPSLKVGEEKKNPRLREFKQTTISDRLLPNQDPKSFQF